MITFFSLKNMYLSISVLALSQLSFANSNININNDNIDTNYFKSTINNYPKSNIQITCWDYAANKYNVDPWMLFAISAVESTFTPNIKSKNKNGTYDLGLMQINTIHIETFKKMGISRHELQNDSCKGIIAAAFILRQSINKFGNNIDGIGGYHSYTKKLRQDYGKKVIKKYNELVSHYYINNNHFSFATYKGKKNKSKIHNVYTSGDKNYIKTTYQSKNNKKPGDITLIGVRKFDLNPDINAELDKNDNGLILKKTK